MSSFSNSAREDRQAATLSDACAIEIMTLVRNGEFGPGTKLSEPYLSKRLGYGISPTKMALNRLAEGGLLERRRRSGTYVRNISKEEYLNLLEVRVQIEGLSARQAAQRVSEAQFHKLEKLAENCDLLDLLDVDEPRRRLQYIQRDMNFHMGIARASGNRFLINVLERQHLLDLSFLYALQVSPKPTSRILSGVMHVEILKALRDRDAVGAERLMKRHIGRIREFLK